MTTWLCARPWVRSPARRLPAASACARLGPELPRKAALVSTSRGIGLNQLVSQAVSQLVAQASKIYGNFSEFEPTKPAHYEAGFIQRFTIASPEHYYYDPNDLG